MSARSTGSQGGGKQNVVKSKIATTTFSPKIDELVPQITFEKKDPLEYLIGPLRYRMQINKNSERNWNPAARGYAMTQRISVDDPCSEPNFEIIHPVWHRYTRLKPSQLQHLPHHFPKHGKSWNPVCSAYAMLYEWKGPANFEKVHPCFQGYTTDHWLEIQPDPVDQTNTAAKMVMTHCPNAPNLLQSARFLWNSASTSPIWIGYCPHVVEETPNPINHELHPALKTYDLEAIQRWYPWQVSPIFFGYKYSAEEIAEVAEKAKVNKGVTISAELSSDQRQRHLTRCKVCHANIPGCPGCFTLPEAKKTQGFNGKITIPMQHTSMVDESRYRLNSICIRIYPF